MNRRRFLAHSPAAAAAAFAVSRAGAAERPFAGPGPYAPAPKPNPVVKPGEFVFAAAHFDHGHISGQCSALAEAGGTLKWIFEPDAAKHAPFLAKYPGVRVARSLDEILADGEVKLVTAAAVPSERAAIGLRVMDAGKDYFTDKTPFTTLAQLEQTRAAVKRTGRKYYVYYSERLHSEAGMFATQLVRDGVVGRVVQVLGLGPHRLNKPTRPQWFFEKARYGGILCDIGSHQCEQFLTYAGARDARVTHAAVGNFANPDTPGLEDFGEASFVGDNGATNHIRVDWFTPDGLSNWGDGRTFILGTKGFIELRKYVDLTRDRTGNQVFIVDGKGEYQVSVAGRVGYRFFGEFILDCLDRTERAMTQEHAFKAAELCLRAQAAAVKLT